MQRLSRIFAKLYPRRWRERYGAEFHALLDDSGADGRTAFNVLTGAMVMQVQTWKTWGPVVLLGAVALSVASWWAGQRPYISPGAHLVFRMDSNPGAKLGFLVTLAGMIGCLVTALLYQDRKMSAA